MNFIHKLSRKRVKIIAIPKWGPYLRQKWELHFADHLNDKEKQLIYLNDECGFLWHLFSYEKRPCLKENKAVQAFNNLHKTECYLFYEDREDAYILENASKIKAEDFHNEEDIYIVDKMFTWTYVETHEKGWFGPYFCNKNEHKI